MCSVTRSWPASCRFETWWVSSSSDAQTSPACFSLVESATTWPQGEWAKRVSLQTPLRTLRPQVDCAWLWMGLRWLCASR